MVKEEQAWKLNDEELTEFLQTVLNAGGIFPLTVTGSSMAPLLANKRDKVFLTSPQRREPRVGEIVLARCDKEKYLLHRIVKKLDRECFLLRGDANMETETVKREDVMAVAEAFVRKGRTVSTESRRYRCYVWIWMRAWRLRPLIFRAHTVYRRKR